MKAVFLDLLVEILARTPLMVISALVRVLVWVWWSLIPVRRRVGQENIARALPGLGPRERNRILRRMAWGVALGYIEIIHFVRYPDRRSRMVRTEGMDEVAGRLARGEGTLLTMGHLGSWDLALLSLGTVARLPFTCVVRAPTGAWSARFILAARQACAMDAVNPKGIKEELYRRLEVGHILMLAFDQRQNNGIVLPFLGMPARTPPSPVAFARRTGLPVYFMQTEREGVGRHVVRFVGPVTLRWTDDKEEDLVDGLTVLNQILEAEVRRDPSNWFWLHRRWA